MLEVKSPWNNKNIGSVETNNAAEIEVILEESRKITNYKGKDFPPKERIQVLKTFQKMISENIVSLAELATSEGGKPITDSIVEIIFLSI